MSAIYKNGTWYGNGGDVDSALSSTSEKPVQNKVLKTALDAKQPSTLESPITIGGTQRTTVEGALSALNNYKAEQTTLADEFSATTAYAVGDRVTYLGEIYEFTAAHTGAWNSAHVQKITVEDMCAEMTSAEVQAIKDAYDATTLQTGAFASTYDIIDLRGTERIAGKVIESDGTERILYEKTIAFGAIPNNTTKKVAHNISNIDKVVRIDGYTYEPSGHYIWCIPGFDVWMQNNRKGAGVYTDRTHVVVVSDADFSAYSETYITIRYLKLS